jgi:hypothetical protein
MKNPTNEPLTEAEPKAPSAFEKLNQFGERNAKPIIIASTVLVIVTVLITAETLYRKSLVTRAERERSTAHSSAELLELKTKYKDVKDVIPLIMLDLANTYYKEHKLDEAEREYQEFVDKFSKENHPLVDAALRGKNECRKNLDFIERSKQAVLNSPTLDVHPLRKAQMAEETSRLREQLKALKDKTDAESKAASAAIQAELDRRESSPLNVRPVKLPHPILIVKTKNASMRFELFEDEAPNAVAQLIALAKSKYFDGMKFEVNDDQLRLLPKEAGAVTDTLSFEESRREGDVGSILLIRVAEGGDNKGAEFVILKKDRPLTNETVIGILQDGSMPLARALKAEDVIDSVTVEGARDHEYKPVTNPKK